MYSQMHQPDILMKVKECLSVSREFPFIDFTFISFQMLNNITLPVRRSTVMYFINQRDSFAIEFLEMTVIHIYYPPQADFVNLEADFHARVPVVICKEKSRFGFFNPLSVFPKKMTQGKKNT